MKTITKYVADDGSEWNTPEECERRDEMIVQVKVAMSILKPTPDDCNWKGYVQQDAAIVHNVKESLYEIANTEGVLKWWIDSQKKDHGETDAQLIDCHPSWFGRMLDGSDVPLGSAYSRLMCIDTKMREWNQPYFAMHPDEGEQVCVG